MKGRLLCFTVFFIFLTLLSTAIMSAEEQVLLPANQSSASFYDAAIESEDVSLFLAGSWKADTSFSTSFGYNPETGFNTELSYPGIAEGFSFSQSPDMTISLLILEKILFESAFTDDFDESTFRLGYIGDEDDFVKIVSAGNMEINLTEDTGMDEFFYIPGGGASSFGIHALLAGPFSEHELLFRFDPQEELHKLYIGGDQLVEIEKQPSDYVSGRMFIIPAAPGDARFYIESGDEDASFSFGNRQFIQLIPEQYSFSSSSGRLLLSEAADGALLMYSPAGDSTVKIYDPGLSSIYESEALYDIGSVLPEDSYKTRAFLTDSAESANSGIELTVELLPEDGLVIVSPSAGGSSLYPLSGIIESTAAAQKIVFQIREQASGYSADNPVPGTIRVLINGKENYNWTESGGTISFDSPPAENDRIEIIYRKNTGSTGGDLLFASANRFSINDNSQAELNGGLRWNLSENYSVPGEETSAYGSISAGLNYDSSSAGNESPFRITSDINAGVKLLIENSSGNLLLKNMSDNILTVPLTRYTVFPSSLSAALTEAPYSLTAGDRGILQYKDYRLDSGITGYYLQDYTADVAVADDNNKAGPYTASAQSDSISGEVLVMDYVLPDTDSWTGVQIPVTSGNNLDLSSSRALSFDYKTDADLSGTELHIEIGSISEDLDGDGILDAENSKYSAGFIFNDPNTEGGTIIGGDNLTGSNGILDTEDFNGNGFLDSEKSLDDAVVLFENIDKPGSEWNRLRLYFTETGSTARSRLTNTEFIRITAVNTAGTEQRGRILFDDFRFEGTSFTASEDGGYTIPEFSELNETMLTASEQADTAISAPTVDASDSNSLMRVEWAAPWILSSYSSPVTAGSYRGISFYYHCPELTETSGEEASIIFSFTDKNGLGLSASVPFAPDKNWHRVDLSMPAEGDTAEVRVDGILIENSAISFNNDASSLSLINFSVSGTDNGVICLDEIFLNGPVLQALTGFSESLTIEYINPLLTAGGIEIIGPLSFSQSGSALLSDDADTIFSAAADFDLYTELSTAVAGAPLSLDFSVSGPAGFTLSGGHKLDIPIAPVSLILSDAFRFSSDSDFGFSKSNSIGFTLGVISASAGFDSSILSSQLMRKWNGELKTDNNLFNLGVSAEFLLIDSQQPADETDYFTAWYSATVLAGDFSYTDLKQRKTSFNIAAAVPGTISGFNTDINFAADIDAVNQNTNSANIRLSLPLNFETAFDTIKFELSYNRYADFIQEGDSINFAGDIPTMFTKLGTGGYLYNSIPYYELFTSGLQARIFDSCSDAGVETAEFTNEARISIKRNYSSRLIDLIIPYSFETGFKRMTKKDYEDLEDKLVWDGIWRSGALNLFGAAGVYPFFDFYFSDELNWSIETLIYDPLSEELNGEILINSGFSVFGHMDDIFSHDLTLYLPVYVEEADSTVKSDFMYVWNMVPDKIINIPFYTPGDESLQIITNEEKFSLYFNESFSTEIKHTTSLMLPGRLTLSAFGLFGWEFNYQSGDKTSLFGFSFGISGSVIY